MKKTLALVMALLMVLSLVACGGGEQKDVIDTKNPILRATANLFDKLANEGGTITLSAEGEVIDVLEENMGITFESLELKTDTKQVLATLNGKLGKTKLSESVYYGNEKVVVNSPAILGGAYGIELGNLTKDLENSIFAPDSGSDYEIGEEVMEQFEEILGKMDGILNGKTEEMIPGLNMEKMTAVITKVSNMIVEKLEELYPTEVTEKDGYTISTVTVTSDKFADLFDVIGDILKDKEVQDMIESVIDAMEEYTGTVPFDVDDLADMVDQYSDMFSDAMDQYGIEASSTVTAKVSKDGMHTEVTLSCEVSAEEYGLEGSFEYAVEEKMEDSKDKFEHLMTVSMDIDGLFEEQVGNTPAAAVLATLKEGLEMKTEWDKKKGDITITEEMGGEEILCVEGNLELSNKAMTFVLESVDLAGMVDTSDYFDSITIKITAGKPKGLSAPKFKNVLGMSEKDIEKLMEEVEENADDLMLGGFGYAEKDNVPVRPSEDIWENIEYPTEEDWG